MRFKEWLKQCTYNACGFFSFIRARPPDIFSAPSYACDLSRSKGRFKRRRACVNNELKVKPSVELVWWNPKTCSLAPSQHQLRTLIDTCSEAEESIVSSAMMPKTPFFCTCSANFRKIIWLAI
eukprot:Pompholyxophrys_sp_v1_NODE_344_length_706_cov_18.367937.p1 type:complete len:123 gc:universal NODE_344_length_706_cov_18.367937:458-90(-)